MTNRSYLISKYPQTLGLKGFTLTLDIIDLLDEMPISKAYKRLAERENCSSQAIEQKIKRLKSKTEYARVSNRTFILLLKEELRCSKEI